MNTPGDYPPGFRGLPKEYEITPEDQKEDIIDNITDALCLWEEGTLEDYEKLEEMILAYIKEHKT